MRGVKPETRVVFGHLTDFQHYFLGTRLHIVGAKRTGFLCILFYSYHMHIRTTVWDNFILYIPAELSMIT